MNNKIRNRKGATAVEFALVAPLFLLVLFACFEFGKISMVEAIAENAAFRAARDVVVLGATIDESIEEAAGRLAVLGVRNADITVEPSNDGAVQTEIDDATDTIAVQISIPMADNFIVAGFLNDFVLEREAVIPTERFRPSVQ